ncbi:MAG TPA: NRDE family protein [Pirellulaceae bacterium]
MALIAVQYKLVPEAPVLIAANREERYSRPTLAPSIQSGKPRVLCGIDKEASGTWLGVNQNGLFVGLSTRRKDIPTFISRSRGLLCLDMLRQESARQALDLCMEELNTGKYQGANFIFADAESGWVVHAGNDINAVPLREGLNIISDRDLNDESDPRVEMATRLLTLQMLDSPVKFLAIASKVFARAPSPEDRPSIVLRGKERGTVSSTLISLGAKPRDAIYQYAGGPPDRSKYEDFSPLLRDILSRGLRESKTRANA